MSRTSNLSELTQPEPFDVYAGISYPVQLRATPKRTADGIEGDWREVMWSADLTVEPEGGNPTKAGLALTASAADPWDALRKLEDIIANHTRDFPEPSGSPAPALG